MKMDLASMLSNIPHHSEMPNYMNIDPKVGISMAKSRLIPLKWNKLPILTVFLTQNVFYNICLTRTVLNSHILIFE